MGVGMNDYKELIEELKRNGLSNGGRLGHHSGLCEEAADAIEQLCTDVARLEADNRAKEQYIAETTGKLARERERDDEIIASLQKELVEAAKERDAAIADINATVCHSCVNTGTENCRGADGCAICCNAFYWRGVREVEHETD